MKAVYDAVIRGEPLTERYTTISGEGVNQPQVLRIRTGAPVRDLIAQAGGEKGDNRYIIGGPMMGYQIISADTPLQKTGNSLLLLPAIAPAEESPCIRCSRCADPRRLKEIIEAQMLRSELIVISGAVGGSGSTTIREILADLGELDTTRVAMHPGSVQGFGLLGDKKIPVFLLPSNPVSALVIFEIFIRPVVRICLGKRTYELNDLLHWVCQF